MNYKMVFHVVGRLTLCLGGLLLLPAAVALLYKEDPLPYILPALLCLAIGLPTSIIPPADRRMHSREGFVSVGLSWIVISLIGCLPYLISGAIPSFTDAFFETVSGFTTTGATVIEDIEAQGRSILFWRCFSQWIGGMGVLVFLLAIMPRSDGRSSRYMHLMRAEVPGPTVGKLVPRISDTARVLYGIYILLTVVEIIFLACGEMDLYEAVTHSLSTAGTGGFGIKNDSLASYSAYSQYVIAVFMILFGTNLSLFYLIICGHFLKAVKSEELRWYLIIIAASVSVVAFCIYPISGGGEETFRASLFQVASIITTSGFTTCDFELWPTLTHAVLICLMFCGGCAGSTAGGMKVSRIMLLIKNAKREVRYIHHPRSVISVKLEGKAVDHETVRGTTSYIIMYLAIFAASVFAVIALEGCDLTTGFTSVVASLGNVGPGLGSVGPADTFAHLSSPTKWILCFDMLAGRLELFPILILFSPSTWKKLV